MTKTILGVTIVSLILLVGASSAAAQSSITFGQGGIGSSGMVTFTGNGDGSASLDIGTCNVANLCTLSGTNNGVGSYSFTTQESGGVNDDLQVSAGFISGLNRGITGPTSMFSYDNGSGGTLAGQVVWNSVFTDGKATITGTLTISLSTLSGGLGVIGSKASIDFSTDAYATDLSTTIFTSGSTAEESSTLSSGEVAATPEPSSMLLFGSGLLFGGGILRRRLTLLA
jgi:PEP-CTERM motif